MTQPYFDHDPLWRATRDPLQVPAMRGTRNVCEGWPIKLAYPNPRRDEWVSSRKHTAPPGKLRGDVRST